MSTIEAEHAEPPLAQTKKAETTMRAAQECLTNLLLDKL
jgi:hypothetical protein